MAPLPKSFDLEAMRLRVRLHRAKQHDGEREAVKRRCAEILAKTPARPEIKKLSDELAAQRRGRPKFGAKYLWFEIGDREAALRDDGKKYEARLEMLLKEFDLKDLATLKTILAEYKRNMANWATNEQDH